MYPLCIFIYILGQIDQVRQIISMNWVQPRVLDHAQVRTLH